MGNSWKLEYLKLNQEYLKKGKYCMLKNERTIVNSKYKKKLEKIFPVSKKSLKGKIKSFLKGSEKLRVQKDGEKLSATAVYFSNAGKDSERVVKFFDYEKSLVLTKCQHKWQHEEYLKNREIYAKYFKIPEMKEVDAEKLTYTEELLPKKNFYDLDKQEVLCKIAEIYRDHFLKTNPVEMCCFTDMPPFSFAEEKDKDKKVQCYIQHGDLSIDNFLWSNGEITFIDFEHQNYYTPFYDLFFLIVNTPDEKRRELLISGTFDRFIKAVFKDEAEPVRTAFKQFALMYYEKRLKKNSNSIVCKNTVDTIEKIYNELEGR